MPSKTQKGNIIIEFLIYIAVCIFTFQSTLIFLEIYITKNEMFKLSNFIAFSIAQDISKIQIFSNANNIELFKSHLKIPVEKVLILCDKSVCNAQSNYIKIDLKSTYEYFNFKIPLETNAQYEMSKFLSVN